MFSNTPEIAELCFFTLDLWGHTNNTNLHQNTSVNAGPLRVSQYCRCKIRTNKIWKKKPGISLVPQDLPFISQSFAYIAAGKFVLEGWAEQNGQLRNGIKVGTPAGLR
jgi:hypothetical protein